MPCSHPNHLASTHNQPWRLPSHALAPNETYTIPVFPCENRCGYCNKMFKANGWGLRRHLTETKCLAKLWGEDAGRIIVARAREGGGTRGGVSMEPEGWEERVRALEEKDKEREEEVARIMEDTKRERRLWEDEQDERIRIGIQSVLETLENRTGMTTQVLETLENRTGKTTQELATLKAEVSDLAAAVEAGIRRDEIETRVQHLQEHLTSRMTTFEGQVETRISEMELNLSEINASITQSHQRLEDRMDAHNQQMISHFNKLITSLRTLPDSSDPPELPSHPTQPPTSRNPLLSTSNNRLLRLRRNHDKENSNAATGTTKPHHTRAGTAPCELPQNVTIRGRR